MIRIIRTYGYAAASEGIVALANFGLLFLLGSRYSGEMVAVYLLVRRVMAVIIPAISLGMPLALVRNLVLYRHGGRLIGLALGVQWLGLALLVGLALWNSEHFTTIALGASGYGSYALPMLAAVAGVAATTVAVATLRGRVFIASATTVLIVALGAIPLAAAVLTDSIQSFLVAVGGGQFLLASVAIGQDLFRSWRPEPVNAPKVMAFAVKATLSEFTMMVLLWLPPTAISRSESMSISGYFSLMLSLVMVLSSPIAPIAASVMPKIAKAAGTGDMAQLRRIVTIVLGVAVAGGLAMVVAGSLAYDFIAHAVLGEAQPLGARASLTMLSAIIPFTVVYALRNTIDVMWSPFRNALIIVGGIAVFLATQQGVHLFSEATTRVGVVLGFALAAWSMAGVALIHGARVLRRPVDYGAPAPEGTEQVSP